MQGRLIPQKVCKKILEENWKQMCSLIFPQLNVDALAFGDFLPIYDYILSPGIWKTILP